MALLVKKFGGSSVATPEKIFHLVDRVLAEKHEGDQIVIVVSAMGDTTDDLVTLAGRVSRHMPKREMDMLLATGEQVSIALLAAAFQERGQKAVSLTGPQAGIRTNDHHTKAGIVEVKADRVLAELEKGNIVVVAGFQGLDDEGDITTLGRGGSDTTAVAVAAGTHADMCEIYTDVDGVYTADPRIVPGARKLQEITFGEMLELARLGAGVMQPRAVEYGEHAGVDIHVRSTFHEVEGTIIRREYTLQGEKEYVVRGVTSDVNVAKIAVRGVDDKPGVAFRIFDALAKVNVDVDMIVQSGSAVPNKNDMVFTCQKADMADAVAVLETLKAEMGFTRIDLEANVAKVSVVGAGMLGSPGIAAGMFGALASKQINLIVVSTSEISISCLIPRDQVEEAVNAVHDYFFPRTDK
ncbi:MAG: aspartate kinase [Succiniclasticum sp.]|nr:aspartate kinase [Selenomonadales bacterium]MDY6303374.1 aspartate kinase [Succiniclasticum sp.]MDY6345287.1 aspartate kinase [Succiniclasticum sp.]